MNFYHVLEAQQFNRDTMESLFQLAKEMRVIKLKGGCLDLQGKILISLFYEPSTRTRLSHESAMIRLGGNVISTENAEEFSSAAKGETIADTARVVAGYGDVLVIRHKKSGMVKRAANAVGKKSIHVINAGDGPGQHPTQALLDLYTMQDELGTIDGLTIALMGDLRYGRTVHSLAYLLAKFEIKKLYLVSHEAVSMKPEIIEYLKRHNVPFEEVSDLKRIIKKVDVLYQTRVQKERFGENPEEYERVKGAYILTPQIVSLMKPQARILHPLPRVNEITKGVDKDIRAAYFRQAHNGVDIRMAILYAMLSK